MLLSAHRDQCGVPSHPGKAEHELDGSIASSPLRTSQGYSPDTCASPLLALAWMGGLGPGLERTEHPPQPSNGPCAPSYGTTRGPRQP